MKINEKGITLIELLATIVILSIVGILIWNIFFQGIHLSKQSISKNQMIQEANYIGTYLNDIHLGNKEYRIIKSEEDPCSIVVEYRNATDDYKFENPNLCFSIKILTEPEDEYEDGWINPTIEKEVNIELKVSEKSSNKDKSSNEITINKILTRL